MNEIDKNIMLYWILALITLVVFATLFIAYVESDGIKFVTENKYYEINNILVKNETYQIEYNPQTIEKHIYPAPIYNVKNRDDYICIDTESGNKYCTKLRGEK